MMRLPATVYVATEPVNLHFSFDRLAGIVREQLGEDPRREAIFVFTQSAAHPRQDPLARRSWLLAAVQASRPRDVQDPTHHSARRAVGEGEPQGVDHSAARD